MCTIVVPWRDCDDMWNPISLFDFISVKLAGKIAPDCYPGSFSMPSKSELGAVSTFVQDLSSVMVLMTCQKVSKTLSILLFVIKLTRPDVHNDYTRTRGLLGRIEFLCQSVSDLLYRYSFSTPKKPLQKTHSSCKKIGDSSLYTGKEVHRFAVNRQDISSSLYALKVLMYPLEKHSLISFYKSKSTDSGSSVRGLPATLL